MFCNRKSHVEFTKTNAPTDNTMANFALHLAISYTEVISQTCTPHSEKQRTSVYSLKDTSPMAYTSEVPCAPKRTHLTVRITLAYMRAQPSAQIRKSTEECPVVQSVYFMHTSVARHTPTCVVRSSACSGRNSMYHNLVSRLCHNSECIWRDEI